MADNAIEYGRETGEAQAGSMRSIGRRQSALILLRNLGIT